MKILMSTGLFLALTVTQSTAKAEQTFVCDASPASQTKLINEFGVNNIKPRLNGVGAAKNNGFPKGLKITVTFAELNSFKENTTAKVEIENLKDHSSAILTDIVFAPNTWNTPDMIRAVEMDYIHKKNTYEFEFGEKGSVFYLHSGFFSIPGFKMDQDNGYLYCKKLSGLGFLDSQYKGNRSPAQVSPTWKHISTTPNGIQIWEVIQDGLSTQWTSTIAGDYFLEGTLNPPAPKCLEIGHGFNIPTIEQFLSAEKLGIRKVIPFDQSRYLTRSPYIGHPPNIYFFQGEDGTLSVGDKSYRRSDLMCVRQENTSLN